jgi:hypothetical protein
MGGFHKTLGQVYKPIRKIVDPLNIMDPFRILPGSSAGFTNKPFTFDKNFALGLFNAPKNQGTYTPMTKGLSSNPQYFAQQQQMLNNMRQQQQAKLANLQSQGQAYPTTAATQSVETAQAPTTTTPVALAQSKVSDTTAPADMPTEFIYKPATAQTKAVAANTFQIPDMSSIKFGGA